MKSRRVSLPNPSIFPGPGKNLWRLQLGDYILAVADFKTRTAPQNTKYVNGFRRFYERICPRFGVRRTMHGRGACKLTASLVRGRTALTHVQHAAPARLLPLENAALSEALAAGCALSSYGGGHVGGDSLEYDIAVEQDATLFVCTQSSAKVYRARGDGLRSSVSTRLEVADGGLAVMAPDPVVPFRNSRFVSTTEVVLQGRGASVVAVEAMGCGRLDGGERWCFDSVEQRLTLTYGSAAASLPTTPIAPVLTDATTRWGGPRGHP